MPEIDVAWFQGRYRKMTETELIEHARKYDQLTDVAQAALRQEFENRSLEPPLIDDEDEPDELEHRNLITVAKHRDMPEALVARSTLESEGIECFLADENLVRMDWLWSNLIGGMRLQVSTEDEMRAREILSQPMPETIPFEEGEIFDQPACPACGSLLVGSDDADKKVLAVSMITGVPLPHWRPKTNRLQCQLCGLRWEDDAA